MIGGVLGQIFVYLAVTAIVAPLAKRIGLGSVLGYLIAGVVIGPFAFGLTGEIEDVAQAGEFGVVILLFLIGLEVRPSLLWEMRRAIFGVGAAQMILSAAVIGLAALAVGLAAREAVAVGFILAMSSTAIVLQLLEERNLRRGRIGHTAFGVLLFQDLAVIPLLALLPLLGAGGAAAASGGGHGHGASLLDGYPVWAQLAAAASAIAAVVVGGRYLTRPIFRGIARAGMREAFTAFALLIVVGSAILMQAVGLSAALGAFLAGVVLADSEFRREIETDIEPFRGLLLGLFFITVGAGLNLPLVAREPLLIAAMVLGLLVFKACAMFGVAMVFRLDWRSAGTTALSLAQGGEFVFVLLGVATAGGVVGVQTAALLTAAVALSMAATPLLVAGWLRLTTSRSIADLRPSTPSTTTSRG